jgi:5-carboxymethyl-2-hydroxymuconate isomerase
MPHLTLNYSDNVSAPDNLGSLFALMHRELRNTTGVRIDNCKSRAVCHRIFLVGDGSAEAAFVHLDVALLEGRSAADRKRVGADLLALLRQAFSSESPAPQLTVEIREIQRAMYFKHPQGGLG